MCTYTTIQVPVNTLAIEKNPETTMTNSMQWGLDESKS